jgi:5-methylthioadenosine/S-adenosylhomocysteine deaminase
LASGIAQVAEMIEAGLNVGVGTDGPASNNDLDMFEEMRLAALLAKTASNDPTTLPARKALEMATIGGARALHMGDITGSLEPGKKADLAVVDVAYLHNWPHFHNHPDTVYSRLVYASKSGDVTDVICNGRWLMRSRQLLTVDQEQVKNQAADLALRIDEFVIERESSPYNKLVLLKGVQQQESFEIQVKAPFLDDSLLLELLAGEKVSITKQSHYRQYDNYFIFESGDPDAARLRYREDEFIDEDDKVFEARSRLTLLGEVHEQEYPNAVMLYRSRYLAPADRSLRFYREYFEPADEVEVHKDRRRWRITYRGTDFAVNIDQVSKPKMEGLFLEIKSRTWSRSDAERKARLITELLELFGVDPSTAVTEGYAQLVLAQNV